MITTEEMITVMQAYADGKQIQIKGAGDVWMDFEPDCHRLWDWVECKYRVKPMIESYNSASEFMDAQKEHGNYIDDNGLYFCPVAVYNNGITCVIVDDNCDTVTAKFTFRQLKEYKWRDGSPCGKEVAV